MSHGRTGGFRTSSAASVVRKIEQISYILGASGRLEWNAMDNDGAHKFAFGVPEVFADLLRLVFPEWADALDFDDAEEVSAAYVQRFGGGFRQRFGDMLWRVPFKEGRLKDGSRPYLLAPVEFQSTVDRTMARRMRDYVEMLRGRLAKAGVAEREGGLPWVLPIVVYNGAERWTASGGMDDLAPLPSSAARLALAPYQQRAYVPWSLEGLLARGGGSLPGLPEGNRAAATLRLQVAGTPAGLLEQLRAERARFAGVGEAATREALHAWAEALLAAWSGDGALPAFEELERLEGDDEMTTISEARLGKWFDDFRAENLERGIEQERARAIERSVARLRRQTMIRFGTAAADSVSDALRGGTTETELDRIDDWIVECGSADELLGRLRAGQSDGGNGSPEGRSPQA